MTHKLIHTPDYLLVVDDSEIKEGDYHVAIRIVKTNGDKAIAFTDQKQLDAIAEIGGAKKIIAHLPLNDSPILEGVDLLPPFEQEDDVDELAKEYGESIGNEDGTSAFDYKRGYNKAKEKYKWTDEDMLVIRNQLVTMLPVGDVAAWDMIQAISKYKKWLDDYVESLSQPKMPVGFECVIEYFYMSSKEFYKDTDWVKCDKAQYESIREEIPTCPLKKVHKETSTPEGHTQWVGKYIY